MQPDEALVAQFLAGDEAAFDDLVRRYEARLRQLAYGFLRRRDLAEEVAQDSFLQAYRKLHTLGEKQAFRSWLYRIAINRCHDELRRRSREAALPEAEDAMDAEIRRERRPPSSEQVVESRELRRRLREAIARLPAKHRKPLVLKEVQGMTYAEISEILGWPVGTVQIRIHRGRLELRERLADLNRSAAEEGEGAEDRA